ncbi:MAG: GNAT family N-acetyltransferase [Spirochaetaceae bacterium]|jgi:GNAT superfamily N-acetyltransferase|nr:GNAT family N-acetyltransferase [Spirochaetaceae bacterium]
MNMPVTITEDNAEHYFRLELLVADAPVEVFRCTVPEYAAYLREEAFRAQTDHVATTWLLREEVDGEIAAYMSLVADAVRLSNAEKELHKLRYPFKTIPAMKIAKLAVGEMSRHRYCGIGTHLIYQAGQIARYNINPYCAARFLTVDADIEHDAGVLAFYQKNGFVPNIEFSGKHRKTISMRLDLYRQPVHTLSSTGNSVHLPNSFM